MGDAAPTNGSIDALFAGARSGRIVSVHPRRVLLELGAADLDTLRSTLRIREGGEQFHCMCEGTLAIELRGLLLSAGRITYHHAQSLRVESWASDAWLEDGPALVHLLAARGVTEPLRELEHDRIAERERMDARAVWEAAMPVALRSVIAGLENGPLGMPARPKKAELEAAIDALRAAHGDDSNVAGALLHWLAAGRGPWSGYASYEEVPMMLLRAMSASAAIATLGDLDSRDLAAAARHFGSHEMVSFQKRVLADLPASFFERARPLLEGDDRDRFDHAARIAERARAARVARAPYRAGEGYEVLGESLDGPLTGLAAVGDALFSCDVRTVVRFEPESVVPRVLAEASEHFVLVAAGRRALYATMNHGEVYALDEEEPRRIAAEQRAPVELAAFGDRAAWLNRDAPGGPTIAIASSAVSRVLGPFSTLVWSLVMGPEHVVWIHEAWRAGGEIRRASLETGIIDTLAPVPMVGPSMASPRMAVSEGEVLVAHADQVLAIDARGRARRCVESPEPVRAVAASSEHIALVIGGDDPRWSLAVAPRSGGRARIITSFARAPYHRHPLVISRGRACIVAGDRVIAAALATALD